MSRWTSTPLAAPIGNQFSTGRNRWSWPQFDALPRLVRDVINFAPGRLGTQRAYDALMAGAQVEAVARQELALARRFSAENCLTTYGPEHPQAARPTRDA